MRQRSQQDSSATQDGIDAEKQEGQPATVVLGKVVDSSAVVVADPAPNGNVVAAPDSTSGAPRSVEGLQEEPPMLFYGRLFVWAVSFIACLWIFFRELPRLMDFIVDITAPITDNKDDPVVMLIVALTFFYFGTVPSLGKRTWFLVMSHIYKWWTLIFILAGHIIGALIDFMFGKWLRMKIDKDPTFCNCCCCCSGRGSCVGPLGRFCDRCFGCSQMLNYIKVMKEPIQERPFRMCLLLVLIPFPSSITAGVLGGYVEGLSIVSFIVPWSIGGLKFIRDVYIGTKVSDLASYIRGESKGGAVDTVFTITSILLTTAVGLYMARYAQKQVQLTCAEAQAREASQETPAPAL